MGCDAATSGAGVLVWAGLAGGEGVHIFFLSGQLLAMAQWPAASLFTALQLKQKGRHWQLMVSCVSPHMTAQ